MGVILSRAVIELPAWAQGLAYDASFGSDEAKMALAIDVASRNVAERTGGPFGAVIFDPRGGVLAIGMNLVLGQKNSTAHGEMVAIQLAEARLGTHNLKGCELFTSCEMCAMCLGASLWSGVSRVVCAATGEDARAIGFDEGPVFPESWRYLEARGIEVVRELSRPAGKRVLEAYVASGAPIYNR